MDQDAKVSTMNRAAQRFSHRLVAAAWRSWAVKHSRTLRQDSRMKIVRRVWSRWMFYHTARGFRVWASTTHRARDQSRAVSMAARCLSRMHHGSLARSWTCWQALSEHRRQIQHHLELCLHRLRHRKSTLGFRRWASACTTHRRQEAILSSAFRWLASGHSACVARALWQWRVHTQQAR